MPWTRYRGTGKYHYSASYDSMPSAGTNFGNSRNPSKNLRESEHYRELSCYIQPPAKMLEAGSALVNGLKLCVTWVLMRGVLITLRTPSPEHGKLTSS